MAKSKLTQPAVVFEVTWNAGKRFWDIHRNAETTLHFSHDKHAAIRRAVALAVQENANTPGCAAVVISTQNKCRVVEWR